MPTHDDIERLGAIRAHANRWLPPQTDAEVAEGIKDCQFLIGLIDEYRKLWSDLSKEMIDQQTLDPKYREVREKWREFRKQSKSDSDIMLCNDSAYHTNQQAYEAGQDSGYKLAMEEVINSCERDRGEKTDKLVSESVHAYMAALNNVIARCQRAIKRQST